MCKSINEKYILLLSHLTRGAWIEIRLHRPRRGHDRRRTSHEVRGLKFAHAMMKTITKPSHLTRGAWIEIRRETVVVILVLVAPHTRCVD